MFQGRFGRILVDSDEYFTTLIAYIHRNPQKHGFMSDFKVYPCSFYQAIAYQSRVKTATVLDWFGGNKHFEQVNQTKVKEEEISHLIGDDFF